MAAVSNNVRNPKPESPRAISGDQSVDETVEITLDPEVLEKVIAAAKRCGQTPSEWIHEALAEAAERRSSQGPVQAVPEQ